MKNRSVPSCKRATRLRLSRALASPTKTEHEKEVKRQHSATFTNTEQETQGGRNNSAYVLNSSLTSTFRKQKPKCMHCSAVISGT